MPPFLAPIAVAVASSAAYDLLRATARRFVPRPAPPPLERDSAGIPRPPRGRAVPFAPVPRGDRRRA